MKFADSIIEGENTRKYREGQGTLPTVLCIDQKLGSGESHTLRKLLNLIHY